MRQQHAAPKLKASLIERECKRCFQRIYPCLSFSYAAAVVSATRRPRSSAVSAQDTSAVLPEGRLTHRSSPLRSCARALSSHRTLLRITPWLPMVVEESRYICGLGCYPVCPYCKLTLDREYQHFCDRCGQELDWKNYSNAIIIFPSRS